MPAAGSERGAVPWEGGALDSGVAEEGELGLAPEGASGKVTRGGFRGAGRTGRV